MAVALHLVAERPDHLAVAEVASLAHVDVASGELERRVRAHALDLLDRVVEIEERRDFDDTADSHDQQGSDEKKCGVPLDQRVFIYQTHVWLLIERAGGRVRSPARAALRAESPKLSW